MTIIKLLIRKDKLQRKIIQAGSDVEKIRKLQERILRIDDQIKHLGG